MRYGYIIWQSTTRKNKSGGLFANYIDIFLKIKQESLGFPQNVKSDEEKLRFIQNLQDKEGITLDMRENRP